MTKADAHQEYRRAVVQACAIELERAQTTKDRHAARMRVLRMLKGSRGTLPMTLQRKIAAHLPQAVVAVQRSTTR